MGKDEQAVREAYRRMDLRARLGYILTYYWWAVLLCVILTVILGSVIYGQLTKKQKLLYIACLNVSIGSDLEEQLRQGYLQFACEDTKKTDVLLYGNMYISTDPAEADHQMAYASRLKLMATINGKLLDLVLMNREALEILSAADYLLDLSALAGEGGIPEELRPYLTENIVVLEDNAIEYNLNEADVYREVTAAKTNALDLSGLSVIRNAGFSDSIYLGIIANTQRLEQCTKYLEYLVSMEERGT
ncbi:MAG: hypothetical protein IKP86_06400 [Anaerolineaceae bacterium]|nr:hypothetical protein [Anaerolineaceae bacterium]